MKRLFVSIRLGGCNVSKSIGRMLCRRSDRNAILLLALRERTQLDAAMMSDEEAFCQHPAWWLQRLKVDWPDAWPSIRSECDSATGITRAYPTGCCHDVR